MDEPCEAEETLCELCGRSTSAITRHHLIPQTRHKNKKNKKNFDRVEVKKRIAWLCRSCHSHVHATLSNKELEYHFNTMELLLAHPDIAKFVAWIKKQPTGKRITIRRSKDYQKSR